MRALLAPFICRGCAREVYLPSSHPQRQVIVEARRCPICVGKIRAGVDLPVLEISTDGVLGGQARTEADLGRAALAVAIVLGSLVLAFVAGWIRSRFGH